MIPLQSFISYPVFGDNATKVKPDDVKYAAGFQQSDVLPAEWMNWAWNKNTQGITDLNRGSCSIEQELLAVLCEASITACESQTNQLLCSIVAIINKCNAGSATKLATGRKINGTSFNGTADITTTKWGTARCICISDSDGTNTGSAVSVDGSGNATLKLPTTIKASLSGNATTATCASCNGSGTAFGTAATCTAGSAVNNLPIVGVALGSTNGQFVATDANGKLKPSGYTASSFRASNWTPTCVACAGANGSGVAFGSAATCAASAFLAAAGCAADSKLLTGKAPNALCVACAGKDGSGCAFGTAARCAATAFLGATACAADSAKLGGTAASSYTKITSTNYCNNHILVRCMGYSKYICWNGSTTQGELFNIITTQVPRLGASGNCFSGGGYYGASPVDYIHRENANRINFDRAGGEISYAYANCTCVVCAGAFVW